MLPYILPGRLIIAPPLIVTEDDINLILETTDKVLTYGDTLV